MKDPVKKLAAALAAVFVLTAAVYINSLSNNLLWDDATFVRGNPFVRDCANLKTAANPLYLAKVLPVKMGSRPLVNISLLLDTCSGASPLGMRVTNLLLHASTAVLTATAAYIFTGALAPAALAGLVFGLHPAAAEAVAVVTFRSQLLCAFFYLSALLTGLIYIRQRKPAYLALSALLALCSMLSNEIGITFPLAFAALLWTAERPQPQDRRRALLYLAVCVAAASAYFWFRLPRGSYDIPGVAPFGYEGVDFLYPRALVSAVPVLSPAPPPVPPAAVPPGALTEIPDLPPLPPAVKGEVFSASPWNVIHSDGKLKLYTMSSVAASYLGDLLLPLNLKSDYNPPVLRTFPSALPYFLVLAGFGWAVLGLRRRAPAAAFGLLLILTALLPVLHIIPIANIKADRYLYLPLAGWALALAAGAAALKGRRAAPAARTALLCYAVFLGTVTWLRNPVFRNELSFFTSAADGDHAAPRAQVNAAVAHFIRGETGEARARFARALQENDSYQVRLFWAEMELLLGSPEKGKELLEAALKERPDSIKGLYLRRVAILRDAEKARAERDAKKGK